MERGEVRKDAGGAGGGELGGLMGAGGHGPTREAGVEGGLDIEGRIAGHERGRGFSVERGDISAARACAVKARSGLSQWVSWGAAAGAGKAKEVKRCTLHLLASEGAGVEGAWQENLDWNSRGELPCDQPRR